MNKLFLKAVVGAVSVMVLRPYVGSLTANGKFINTPIPNLMPGVDGTSAIWVALPAAAAFYLSK